MEIEDLVGSWRLLRAPTESPHVAEFTDAGDLVLSYPSDAGPTRVLLTFELDGYSIAIDQPSHPRVEKKAIVLTLQGELILGEAQMASVYVRNSDPTLVDEEAAPIALAGHAIRHALHSAHVGEPFIPFVMWAEEGKRHLARFVSSTPEQAERAARQHVASLGSTAQACAFACDGFLTDDSGKRDAVLCTVSRRRPRWARTYGQMYQPMPPGFAATPISGITPMSPTDSWFRGS